MSDLVVDARVTVPSADLSWSAARSSGPGGQNVNKVNTKVELRFDLVGTRALSEAAKSRLRQQQKNRLDAEGRLLITSQATRDQSRNLELARDKLRSMIAAALVVPKRRKETKPSRGAQRRRLEDKRQQAQKKQARGKVRKDDW